jgi:outer membrane murein-binding lipoprotein Lpp
MSLSRSLMLVTLGVAVFSGCGASKVAELTAEIQVLKSQVAELKASNAALETQLTAARTDLARFEEIRQGYETARTEFQKNLAQLAPALGLAASPLPPFEQLKDSSWVSRFAPNPELTSGLKDLEQQFRGLLEAAGGQPGATPRTED